MKIINNILEGIGELKKEALEDPKLNISHRLRFDFPELIEDKAALGTFLDRLDMSVRRTQTCCVYPLRINSCVER